MTEILFTYQRLYGFAEKTFLKMGCSPSDAAVAARTLLSADIRGVDSHGIARLSGYIRLWEAGRVNATPAMAVIHETPSTAVIDGDSGLGLVVAPFAMKSAIEKARQVGTGWVSVQNSNHFGIAGFHAMMALEADMIGIAMTNASALVAPTHAAERMLGTNPISVAIPAGAEPPFVADLATTTVANGKLEILQRKGLEAPLGWVQDAGGAPTADAAALKKGGALLPLGGVHAGHKGYALGSVVDIFSGVLSGANYGPWVPPFPAYLPMPESMPGKGIGHFLGAMRIDAFRKAEDFKADMDNWLRRFRNAKPGGGAEGVLVPGDPERLMEKERKEKGIPLLPAVLEDLHIIEKKLDIQL